MYILYSVLYLFMYVLFGFNEGRGEQYKNIQRYKKLVQQPDSLHIHCESKKTKHPIYVDNFMKN